MGINNSKLLSGRVPVTPYSNLTSDRYQFLGLNQAEPSLGAGDANSVLTLSTSNTRVWSNTLTLTSLNVSGASNLGNIANVHIFGGANGQLIQTDGNGNLVFADPAVSDSAAPMPFYIPVGETYYVPENFQGLFTVPIEIDGALEVNGILAEVGTAINSLNSQIIFDDNGELTGNTGFTFDTVSGNLSVPGSGIFTGSLLPSANIIYDLGNTTNRWNDLYLSGTTIYIGNSTISTAGANLVFTNGNGGQFVLSGNANTTSFSSAGGASVLTLRETDITFTANGNANIFKITGTGVNVAGTLSSTGNAAVSGILTDNYYYANGQPLDVGGNPGGANTNIQFNNNGEFGGSANFTFNSSTNVLTVVGNIDASNANLGNIVTANYLVSNSGCVLIGNGAIAVIGNAAGIFNSGIVDINLGLVANVVVGSTTGNVTIQGNLIANNNVTVTGTVSGNLLTGTLTTQAQPNITSTGTLTSLSVSGNANVGNIGATGGVFTTVAGTLTTASQPNITSVGILSGLSVSGGIEVNGNVQANTNIVVTGNISSGNANLGNLATANYFSGTLTTAAQPNITSTGTLTSLSVTGTINSGNLSVSGNVDSGNLNSSFLSITGNINSGNLSASGNSSSGNLSVTANVSSGNISVTANVSSGNISASGNINSGNISASGNINSGNISVTANVSSGNISASGNISSGNLNASFLSITGNINSGNLSVSGNVDASNVNSSFLSVTGNIISGNINSGNATFGNITSNGTGGNITGANVISANTFSASGNISSANLNASFLSITGNIITGNLSTSGNIDFGNLNGSFLSITGNINSGNISASGNINSANLTISNTIDAVNIKVTDLYSKRTSIPITSNTLIDIFPTTQFRSAKYTMRAGNGTDFQALEVLLVHNSINSIITVYGSLSTSSTDLVAFDTDISAGNVNVYATAVGANTNLNLMGTYVPD